MTKANNKPINSKMLISSLSGCLAGRSRRRAVLGWIGRKHQVRVVSITTPMPCLDASVAENKPGITGNQMANWHQPRLREQMVMNITQDCSDLGRYGDFGAVPPQGIINFTRHQGLCTFGKLAREGASHGSDSTRMAFVPLGLLVASVQFVKLYFLGMK
jgi:hypothetical protein